MATEDARLVQDRSTHTASDGSPIYQIINTLTHKGQLPDHGVFVFAIAAPANRALDTFFRIAEVPDLSAFPFGRDNAVSIGGTYYRISSLTATTSSFSEADALATTIKERVDSLVQDWIAASGDWVGSEAYTLPTGDPSIEDTYKNAYSEAYSAYVSALVARDDVQESLDAKKGEIERYRTLAAYIEDIKAKCDYVGQAENTYATKVSSVSAADCSVLSSIQAYYLPLEQSITGARTPVDEAAQTAAAVQTTLEGELEELLEAYTNSQTAIETTKRLSNAAEANLVAYCPNIDVVALQNAAIQGVAVATTPAVATLEIS